MRAIIHDEFDAEILTYILNARHPAEQFLPELFNGTTVSSMTPPAPLLVLLYHALNPQAAFFVSYLLIIVISYTGMFLCVNKAVHDSAISAFTAVCFALLPFYPVYGLSVMGQPLFVYAFWELRDGENRQLWKSYCIIVLMALLSSPILVGYADVLIALAVFFFGKKRSRHYLLAWGLLVSIYIFCNFRLLSAVLGGMEGFVSHKVEFMPEPKNFLKTSVRMFVKGHYHPTSNHFLIIPFSASVLTWSFLLQRNRKQSCGNVPGILFTLLLCAAAIAAFYGLWHCDLMIKLRARMGGLFLAFQADRFYWLYPVLWFMILGYSLFLFKNNCKALNIWRTGKWVYVAVSMCFLVYAGVNSSIPDNLKALMHKGELSDDYASISEFFQPDLFEEIGNHTEGPKDSYRVVSVGLYPSIALYNGFYCLDGYSNNYNLAYKHEFRQIIKGELEKNNSLKHYYDDWGNRCYVFSSEIPKQYYIKKDSDVKIMSLNLDYEQMKSMGCKYIFAGVPIADEHLALEGEYTSDDCFYRVLVYRLIV